MEPVRLSEPTGVESHAASGDIAVVVLTHNRVHLLQKCVENVLLRASGSTREIVIWDNASTDATVDYLDSLDDPRIRVVHSEENIGQNGYARAFRLTTAPYLIELDDDVVNAPAEWDLTMLDAFKRAPARSDSWLPTSRTTRTIWPRATGTTSGLTNTRSWSRTVCDS